MRVSCLVAFAAVIALAYAGSTQESPCANERFPCDRTDNNCGDDGKCKCIGNYNGAAHLGCFQHKWEFCFLGNDPQGRNLARQPEKPVEVAFPCQYLASHWLSEKQNRWCEVKVWAAEKRTAGKYYLSGFMIDLEYDRSGPDNVGAERFYATGREEGGQYIWELGRWDPDTNSYIMGNTELDVKDLDKGSYLQKANFKVDDFNRVFVELELCALELYFRPPDFTTPSINDQDRVPGLILAVDIHDNEITYKSLDTSFCMAHDPSIVNIEDERNSFGFATNEEIALFRAVKSTAALVPEDFVPGLAQDQCLDLGATASATCVSPSARISAVQKCMRLFGHEFAKCYSQDDDSGDLMSLFDTCWSCICLDQIDKCSSWDFRGCNSPL